MCAYVWCARWCVFACVCLLACVCLSVCLEINRLKLVYFACYNVQEMWVSHLNRGMQWKVKVVENPSETERLHNIIKQRKSYNIAKIGPKIVEGQIKIINAKSQTAILNSLPQYIHGNAANKLASWRAINEYRPKLECYGSCLSACVSSCKINTCQK